MHAYVAAAGVLQNAKLWQCNVAVEISEGFRQLLIVRCGCSPFRDLQNSIKNGSQQSIKRRLGGTKMELEAKKMKPWALRAGFGDQGTSQKEALRKIIKSNEMYSHVLMRIVQQNDRK